MRIVPGLPWRRGRRLWLCMAAASVLGASACQHPGAGAGARDAEVAAVQAHLAGGPGVTAVTAQWSSGIDSPAGVAVAYTVVPSTMQAAADALADDAVASVWRSRIEPLTVITATVTTSETKRILVSRVVTLTDKATTDKLTASYGERPVPQPTGAGSGQ